MAGARGKQPCSIPITPSAMHIDVVSKHVSSNREEIEVTTQTAANGNLADAKDRQKKM
jgi:hypothetical protein